MIRSVTGFETPSLRFCKLLRPSNVLVGVANPDRLRARISWLARVPNLQIGNPEGEALASRNRKLEPFDKAQDMLPIPNPQAVELGN
jgi:hypothetical protein